MWRLVVGAEVPRNLGIDAILQGYPGPVRLASSRLKWALVLLICLGFTAIGVAMLRDGDLSGWLAVPVGLFALGVPIAAIMLLPGAGGLVLDSRGFAVTTLFRTHRLDWTDVSRFTVATVPAHGSKMVVYDNQAPRSVRLAQYNIKLVGRNSGMPDTYGLKPEALAELMARWRERALSAAVAPNHLA